MTNWIITNKKRYVAGYGYFQMVAMIFPEYIKRDVSLKPFNTFGMDVSALAYMKVVAVDDLERIYGDPSLRALPRLVLGGGSNVLLTGRFEGLVLHMANMGIELHGEDGGFVYVRSMAGERWHDLVSWTLKRGLGGLENLSLVPGTVGAAPVQNIGAYGAELQDCFHSLRAFDFTSGEVVEMNRVACRFAYRDSVFKHEMKNRMVIVDVTFALPKHWRPNLAYAELKKEWHVSGARDASPAAIGEMVARIRSRKLPDPAVLGNAGSFFRNPDVSAEVLSELRKVYPDMPAYLQADGHYRVAAGWLIDQCGWKGRRIGDAGVSPVQALVLVNFGHASGKDILALAKAIEEDVFNRFSIRLEPEPDFV